MFILRACVSIPLQIMLIDTIFSRFHIYVWTCFSLLCFKKKKKKAGESVWRLVMLLQILCSLGWPLSLAVVSLWAPKPLREPSVRSYKEVGSNLMPSNKGWNHLFSWVCVLPLLKCSWRAGSVAWAQPLVPHGQEFGRLFSAVKLGAWFNVLC